MNTETLENQAFIDGQNLYLSTTTSANPWHVDLYKFREYLRRKYKIAKAFYFLGCMNPNNQELYNLIMDAGFLLVFRAHGISNTSEKKGNVDTDIVFTMMRTLHEAPEVEKMLLVSGDGDYYKTIKYLRDKGKLGKILFPAQHNMSSLYRQIGNNYYDFLDRKDVREKIELKD